MENNIFEYTVGGVIIGFFIKISGYKPNITGLWIIAGIKCPCACAFDVLITAVGPGETHMTRA